MAIMALSGANNTVARINIVQKEDPVLRAHAKQVPLSEIGTKKLNDILAMMKKALDAEADGVAIAAPQIGVSLRIFIVSGKAFAIEARNDGTETTKPPSGEYPDMICINPEITKRSKKKVRVPEGCLSVRWLYGNTLRNEKATIKARDQHGKLFTYGGSGLIAQIFQHETDHLDGILFIDHAKNIEELPPEKQEEMRNGKDL